MTQTRTEGGLVRVTVVGDGRRVDLAIPGAVPVAELLPELARSVGLLDPRAVHAGYRLVTSDGRTLAADAGLTLQGVEDGGVLTVAAGVDDEPPRVYDDVVEAMADMVERDLRPWEPAAGRRTALVAAAVLLSLGALALGLQRVSVVAAAAAAVVAVLLVASAVVLARVRKEPEVAVVLAWMAVVHAAVAGFVGTPGDELLGVPVAASAAAAFLVGVVALTGLDSNRHAIVPAVGVAVVAGAVAGVVATTGFSAGQVATVALVVVVLGGSIVPWLALGATRAKVEQAHSHADITAEPATVDPGQVLADVRLGHELLLAMTMTVGLVLVLTAPLAVDLGLAGALVAVLAATILLLRTRQYRAGTEVLTGLASGLCGLVSVVVSVMVLQPAWRPALTLALALSGAVLLLLTLLPGGPSVRRGRVGDVVESVALVALLPLLVAAIGVVEAVRG